jgi:hypothetical protein
MERILPIHHKVTVLLGKHPLLGSGFSLFIRHRSIHVALSMLGLKLQDTPTTANPNEGVTLHDIVVGWAGLNMKTYKNNLKLLTSLETEAQLPAGDDLKKNVLASLTAPMEDILRNLEDTSSILPLGYKYKQTELSKLISH